VLGAQGAIGKYRVNDFQKTHEIPGIDNPAAFLQIDTITARRLFMKPKVIFFLVMAALFLIFLIQNTQVITLRLYFWEISMSQIILIPLAILIGFVLGFIVGKIPKKDKKPEVEKKDGQE
jgi:uncharacterized integral membrane protein